MSIQVASLYVSVDGETAGADSALNRVDQRLNDVAGNATRTGAMMTAGLTLPLGLLGRTALGSAMDYQTMMAVYQESSGATIAQMRLVGDEAIRLGGDLKLPGVSSADSLAVMLELSKGGLSVESSMAAARGALSLAIIESMGFARAAQIQSGALNTFNLQGTEATRVADMLAAGSNASAASVLSLADGMGQAGFSFANANQSLPDLITSLALLANNGLSGSDAGTALKNAFMRMMSPTKEARGVMNELGISFFDAQGNMLPLVEIIGMLNGAMAGMTQEQRLAALETIFLSDGMKAMLPLLGAGSEGYLSMMEAVTKEGAAADMAAAKNSGLRGAIEGLKSTVETFLQTQAAPFLGMLEGWVTRGSEAVAWLGTLDQRFINAGIALGVVLAVAGPLLTVLGMLAGVAAFLATPLGIVIGVVAALAGVFAGDLGGATTGTIALFNGLAAALQQFAALPDIQTMFAQLGEAMRLAGTGDLSGAFSSLLAGGDSLGAALGGVWSQMQPALQAIGNQIWGEVTKWGMFLSRWIPVRVPFVLQELEQLWQVVSAWLVLKGTELGFSMALWGLQLLGWAYRQIPLLMTELEGLGRTVLAWALLKGVELGFAVAQWGIGFVAWIAPMGIQFIAGLALWALGVYSWILAQVPILQGQFLSWWNAFVGWVGPAFVDFMSRWPGLLNQFLDWIEAGAGPLLLSLGNWAVAFVSWILPMIPDLLVGLGTVLLGLLVFVANTGAVLTQRVLSWAVALTGWIVTTAIPKLLEGLGGFMVRLMVWLKEGETWLKGQAAILGTALVQGMMNGISSWWGTFVAWLNQKIAELPLAVKIALGLVAPSFVAAGAAVGVTGTASEPPAPTGDNKAMLVMPTALGGGALAMANSNKSGGSSTAGGSHTHYHTHHWTINGKLDIRSVVREMIREVQTENR